MHQSSVVTEFRRLFGSLAAIGRDPRGGWTRLAWTSADDAAGDWFAAEAAAVDLELEADRNTNLWAWWGRGPGAVAAGSHLDTVPNGGAYDGALGVVSALLAVRLLKERGRSLRVPLAVAAFRDEEGAASGLATFGSRLAAGGLDPARARAAMPPGADPGPDPTRLGGLSAYVELHIEQGRGLADYGAPLAVGTGIWPHGRWRLELTGEANHAGTTRLADRRDPTLPLAVAIESARGAAAACGGVATIGRVGVGPGATNAVPELVTAWLDARAPDEPALDRILRWWQRDVEDAATGHGVGSAVIGESRSPAVIFDSELSDRVAGVLGEPPRLATAAGHDAGALAAALPTAMIFVRNPTGASHTPAETASEEDCVAGVEALAAVLAELGS